MPQLFSSRRLSQMLLLVWLAGGPGLMVRGEELAVDYAQVAGVFQRYCSGCHQDADAEGDFSVGSYEALRGAESERGDIIVPGAAEESLLYQLIASLAQPAMPPEDEPQPAAEEIELIRRWIAQGAKPPQADSAPAAPARSSWDVGPAAPEDQLVTAAVAVDARHIAVGRYGRVELVNAQGALLEELLTGLPGRVTSLRLSPDRRQLIVGAGQVGREGRIYLVDLATRKVDQEFVGHTDAVHAAAISPNGQWLASGSYDRNVILWEIASAQPVARMTGHNGPIYDLDFHPSGQALATASGDQTVKLWQIPSGQRLDTLGQPEGEMRCVRFSPDGQTLLAGGADRQIRRWQIVSTNQAAINPMLDARFAHERAVLELLPWGDDLVVSSSADGRIKLWTADRLLPLGELTATPHLPVGLCAGENEPPWAVVDLKGSVVPIAAERMTAAMAMRSGPRSPTPSPTQLPVDSHEPRQYPSPADVNPAASERMELAEVEPNDRPTEARSIRLPARISGTIAARQDAPDVDLYRFQAAAGEPWIIEVTAAQEKSPLDSLIDVLDANGQPVLQARLQALRESYFTFRGKDSSTSDDFRMHKWEEMELDEYLYAGGEVTRLWLYPRGPDSGFKVYPGAGPRHTFFGTTATAHALGATAYVVRPLALDEQPLPNGLPVFPVYFENDDDPLRERGADSRLTFRAPADGEYLLRVRDARGFGGDDYRYRVDIRRPQPDFELSFSNLKLAVPAGSGREWAVTARRLDGLSDPIEIRLLGLPDGVRATNPLIIEAHQRTALGTIYVEETLAGTTSPIEIRLTAAVMNGGQPAPQAAEPRELPERLELTIVQEDSLRIALNASANPSQRLEELTIRPGQTSSAWLTVDRRGLAGQIGFGKDDAGRNLPHGAFVDHVGLNGLLITETQDQRELFITAAPKVQPGRYQFHFRSETPGNPTSPPIWLHVLPR